MHADPADVVSQVLTALERPTPALVIAPGRNSAAMAAILPRLPRRPTLRLLERMMRAPDRATSTGRP